VWVPFQGEGAPFRPFAISQRTYQTSSFQQHTPQLTAFSQSPICPIPPIVNWRADPTLARLPRPTPFARLFRFAQSRPIHLAFLSHSTVHLHLLSPPSQNTTRPLLTLTSNLDLLFRPTRPIRPSCPTRYRQANSLPTTNYHLPSTNYHLPTTIYPLPSFYEPLNHL